MTSGRARRALLVAAGVVLSVIVVGAVLLGARGGTQPAAQEPAGSVGAQAVASPAPDDWIADLLEEPGSVTRPEQPGPAVCTSDALRGPASPPQGAVVVSPSDDLPAVVEASPAGSLFWLAPGVHRLGRGPFDQVIPRKGDTFVGGPGAVLDGQRISRYAFTGGAPGVTIAYLTIENFGGAATNNDEGVVNHDAAAGWAVLANTIRRNAGAGVMVGSDNRIVGNCLQANGQYGFNAYHPGGVRNIELRGNEITGNNTDDWERRREGCGCTGGGKFWDTTGARIIGNWVHDNRGAGLWADTNNAGFLVQGNYISDNDAEGVFYETSYNAAVLDNTFVRNAIVNGPKNPGFPTAAVYLSESGSDPRVPGPYGERLRVSGNHFVDNWSGVLVWENADRFAGSPANTSTDATTLVNPKATVEACATPSMVARKPLFDDCRWKSQNILVEKNVFVLDPATVPGCATSTSCGFNGVLSNYGTYPEWSPYQGFTVADQITFKQNNVWRNNDYTGPWSFIARSQDTVLDSAAWQAPPYGQDAASTFNPG